MSFILEALRKSEAERRRGQTPDLLTEAVPVAPAARASTSNRGRIVAIVAASLIALLLLVWVLRPTAPAQSATASAPAPSSTKSTTAAVAVPALPAPASLSPPPTRVAAAPAVQKPKPAPAVVIPPTAAATTTLPTASQTHELQSRVAESDITAPTARVATTEPANAAVFASPDAPLKLADLPTDERQQLPALKVSMLMWAPDTTNRFAIIDGTRVSEGGRVGDATVEAIQQDGVMLNWRGRRIRLPIR
jgi:general secretion pathway protein B